MNIHLRTWLADHHNYRALLALLEEQLSEFLIDGSPDYELMLDIMHYLGECPDQLHHVHEDNAYAALAAKHPEFKAVVTQLHQQHKEIIASGLQLASGLRSIVSGNMMAREQINSKAKAYAALLQDHLLVEEKELFPALQQNVDCLSRLPGVSPAKDPVFGTVDAERYRSIRKRLGAESA